MNRTLKSLVSMANRMDDFYIALAAEYWYIFNDLFQLSLGDSRTITEKNSVVKIASD